MSRFLQPRQRFGTGAPSNTLGNNNDTYTDLSSGAVYTKTAGAWASAGVLPQPASGPSTRYGTGAPSSNTGNVGDYYIDESTGNIYGPKVSTTPVLATAVANSNPGSHPLTIPSNTPIGAVMIVVVSEYGAINFPLAGWTQLYDVAANNGLGGHIWTKVCASGDPGSSINLGSSTTVSYAFAAYTGASAATSIIEATGAYSASATGTATGALVAVAQNACNQGSEATASLTVGGSPATFDSASPFGSAVYTFSGIALVATDGSSHAVAASYTNGGGNNGSAVSLLDLAVNANAWTLSATPPTPVVAGLTRYGTGAPGAGVGVVGDYYVDKATGSIYGPKITTQAATFRASTTAHSVPGSNTIVVPAQVQAGDVMVLVYAYQGNAQPSAPSGWTLLTSGNTDAGANASFAAYYKVATSGDIGATVMTLATSTYVVAALAAYYNVSTPVVVGTPATGSPASFTDAGVSGSFTAGADVIVRFFLSMYTATTLASDTGTAIQRAFMSDYYQTAYVGEYAIDAADTLRPATSGTEAVLLPVKLPSTGATPWPLASSPVLGTKWIASKTSAYTAAAGDAVPCDTTGGTFAVALPVATANGATIRTKWVAGTTAPTVTAASGATLDPTWSGFTAVGQSIEWSYNLNNSVWETV